MDSPISADDLTLYFQTSSLAIWCAARETIEDAWGKPIRLGPEVESTATDLGPCVTSDGSVPYSWSFQPGNLREVDFGRRRSSPVVDFNGGVPGQVVVSQVDGANWLVADAIGGYLMTDLSRRGGGRVGPKPLVSESAIVDGCWHRIGFVWDGAAVGRPVETLVQNT
jgi:hypothetical protein